MRLASFVDHSSSGPRLGVVGTDEMIVDLAADPGLPQTISDLLERPADAELIKRRLASLPRLRRQDVALYPPLPAPARNIFCVGKNYRSHAREFQSSGFDASSGGEVIPEYPAVFTKPASTLIGAGAAIPASADRTGSVDYEGELVVVIGKGGRDIPRDRALQHVFGYTLANDVTSRITQQRHKQWFLGKGLDGFCPMGPAVLTADEVPDPNRLRLQTRVNGELRQDALVADLIFGIPELISLISTIMTLQAGDVIATGTPEGVGIGYEPPRYLQPGDRVEVAVREIGTLSNPVC